MALSYVHLGQRLELAFAGGVIGHSSTPFTSLPDTIFILNAAQMLLFILYLSILSRRPGLHGMPEAGQSRSLRHQGHRLLLLLL
jgi:hypothetical protein